MHNSLTGYFIKNVTPFHKNVILFHKKMTLHFTKNDTL